MATGPPSTGSGASTAAPATSTTPKPSIAAAAAATDDTNMADASTAAAPASPPLPQKPTPVAPGPRASRFQDVLESSLSHTLGRISWDNFSACYPSIALAKPEVLQTVQRQMVDRLGQLCRREFTGILEARQVVARLNELEALVRAAEVRRDEGSMQDDAPVPPHLLPAPQVLAAHMAPHLAQQQSQLNAKLQTTQAHNAKLFAEVQRQRAEIESLVALVEKAFSDIDGANKVLDEVADDLAEEGRNVEVEMSSS